MTTADAKKTIQPDWHPRAIQGALEDIGYTLTSLAREHGLTSSSSLTRAIRLGGATGERRIAEALGMSPQDIWPSRYTQNGSRKPTGYNALKCTRARTKNNGKK